MTNYILQKPQNAASVNQLCHILSLNTANRDFGQQVVRRLFDGS